VKGNQEFIEELERLFSMYESEVNEARIQGVLTESTARTYLFHSRNFVKWFRNDFQPSGKLISESRLL
jgi:hypothetical protein